MISLVQLPFFQYALLAGLLASVACGIVGSIVVVRRMTSLSGSLAHGVFGGLGLGHYFGFSPFLGALASGIGIAYFTEVMKEKFQVREDTLISLIWSVGMAVGILLIFFTTGYASDLFGYLFGNILLVSKTDLGILAGVDLAILALMYVFFRAFQALSFDSEYTRITGVNVFWLSLMLLVMIAVTIVVLIKVVGVILVLALLTLPAAAAEIWVKNLKQMMGLSVVLSATQTTLGMLLSYYLNAPSGPVIILLSLACYLIMIGLKKWWIWRSR